MKDIFQVQSVTQIERNGGTEKQLKKMNNSSKFDLLSKYVQKSETTLVRYLNS